MAASPFRQAALDRLSTPEQLDRTLFVTSPRGWLAIATLAVIAAVVAVWAFLGEVATYVGANGILLSRGGTVVDVVAAGSGTVARIAPAVGDLVEEGAVVAEIANLEVSERHASALALVEERRSGLADTRAAVAEEDALIAGNLARQRERLNSLETSSREAVETARERLESHRQLFADRVVTRVTVERSQAAFDQARRDLFGVLSERDNLESTELQRRNRNSSRVGEAEARLQAAERQLNELGVLLDTRQVVAQVAGRVVEIKTQLGAVIRAGQPTLSIQSGADRLGVLIYVPPADGRKVEAGMEALVAPSTVRASEYGYVRGRIESISEFPASVEGMVAVLQNRDLAQTFSQNGPPYAGQVILETDPETASGFAWTSPKASGEVLTDGTLASIEVKIQSQAPITLVVPLLRETFGL